MNVPAIKHTVTWTHADTGKVEQINYVISRHDRGVRAAEQANEARTDALKQKLADYSLACDLGKATNVVVTREPVVLTDPVPAPPTR